MKIDTTKIKSISCTYSKQDIADYSVKLNRPIASLTELHTETVNYLLVLDSTTHEGHIYEKDTRRYNITFKLEHVSYTFICTLSQADTQQLLDILSELYKEQTAAQQKHREQRMKNDALAAFQRLGIDADSVNYKLEI